VGLAPLVRESFLVSTRSGNPFPQPQARRRSKEHRRSAGAASWLLRGTGTEDRRSIAEFPKISDHAPRCYIGGPRADTALSDVAASSSHSRAEKEILS